MTGVSDLAHTNCVQPAQKKKSGEVWGQHGETTWGNLNQPQLICLRINHGFSDNLKGFELSPNGLFQYI